MFVLQWKEMVRLLFLLERQIYREERGREEELPSDDSLPRRPPRLELSQSEARSLFRVSHVGAGSQSLGPSSTAFSGHRQGAGSEARLPG